MSSYESHHREPSVRTLRRLIEATGHRLTIALEPGRRPRLGLPDTRLGRKLRYQRQAIARIAAARGAHNVRVFGSVARGEYDDASDVDLLVDLDADVGLVQLLGLRRELTQLLGVDVDVVPSAGLKPRFRENVITEAIAL